jgi:hypothetical protein
MLGSERRILLRSVSNGMVHTNHEAKTALVDDFYDGLLGKCSDREFSINLEQLGIPDFDLTTLDAPFNEEAWDTIKQLPSDKAPGPDRYTGRFYKTCWEVIKSDVMAAISAVGSRKFMNFQVLNTALITLIPKKEGADQVKDFRPISLVHSFAKLITKILANRLASKLNDDFPKSKHLYSGPLHPR